MQKHKINARCLDFVSFIPPNELEVKVSLWVDWSTLSFSFYDVAQSL